MDRFCYFLLILFFSSLTYAFDDEIIDASSEEIKQFDQLLSKDIGAGEGKIDWENRKKKRLENQAKPPKSIFRGQRRIRRETLREGRENPNRPDRSNRPGRPNRPNN